MTRPGVPLAFFELMMLRDTDDCIVWPYATFGRNHYGWLKGRGVHRMACERRNGPAPDGADAAHACGVPLCFNPRHLRWASRKANMADQLVHGTRPFGSAWPHAKLTEADIPAIRRRYAAGGVLQRELAAEYGVTQSLVSKIIRGQRWRSR